MAQLTCKNLTLGYDNRAIQEDLNFSIDAGDYLCIVGENGSGKSTLMKTLLHLQAPISGSIELGDGLKKKRIGYLPQQTLVQRDFPASVREIVLSGCQSRCGWRPFYNKEEKMVAQRAMEKMMIQDLADQCYRELSGGQQQRVLLARALCAAQKILLLDEPVSGLDPRVTAEMYQLIRNLNKKDGITIIMISHDIAAAVNMQHISCISGSIASSEQRNSIWKAVWERRLLDRKERTNKMFETLRMYFQYPFVRYALIVGVLIALCSSLLGVTLVLKRFSFIGDGLSHVAFGAMAIASVLNITNNMLFILPVTVICAILLLRAGQNTRIKGDAAIAMISVGALAIGYLLMNLFFHQPKYLRRCMQYIVRLHIDPDTDKRRGMAVCNPFCCGCCYFYSFL